MKTNKYCILIAFLFITAIPSLAQSNFNMPKVAQRSQMKPATPKAQERKPQKANQKEQKKNSSAEVKPPKTTDMQQLSDYQLELKAGDGNPEAQYILGKRWVLTGDSVNVAKGVNWLTISARQDYPDAQYALGNLYYKGYGVERNLWLSRQLMQRAAAKGHVKAQKFLKSNHF